MMVYIHCVSKEDSQLHTFDLTCACEPNVSRLVGWIKGQERVVVLHSDVVIDLRDKAQEESMFKSLQLTTKRKEGDDG